MIDRLRGRIERVGDRPAPAPRARREPDPLAPILWLAYALIGFAFYFYYLFALFGPAYGHPPLWQAAVVPQCSGPSGCAADLPSQASWIRIPAAVFFLWPRPPYLRRSHWLSCERGLT